MRGRSTTLRRLVVLGILVAGSAALALPITLRDSNGTRYNINTDVVPQGLTSTASGAITDATFQKPVTVTSYFVGFTFFGFTTVYTIQRQVNVPLKNAFAGFNGLVVTSINGRNLPTPPVFNPGENLAVQDCPQGGVNRQLTFQSQAFPVANLQLTRKVFVPNNGEFLRWLNIVTNTGQQPMSVGLTLRGVLGSRNNTRITNTSTGDSGLSNAVQWFTSAQQTPKGQFSTEPKLGFVVQGPGSPTPTQVAVGSQGQTAFSYTPTIDPGESVIVLTFVTVQGSTKEAKSTVQNLITLPSKAITCLSQSDLRSIINFAPITPPVTKKATITLNFKKTGADTVAWNGTLTVGAGISLKGQSVTIDVGGATQSFVLSKKGSANNGGGNKFSLQPKLQNGVTKAGPAKFSFHLKGDFQTELADFGLTDTTVKNVPVTIPASFTAGPQNYATEQSFTYTATEGKKGTAKNS